MNMTLNVVTWPFPFFFHYTSFITESNQTEREILIKRAIATWYARSLSLVMSTDSRLLLVRVPMTLVSRGGSRDRTHKTVSLTVSVNRTWCSAKFWQRARRVLVKEQLVSVYITLSREKFTTLTWITWNGNGEQSSRCPVYNGVAYIIN